MSLSKVFKDRGSFQPKNLAPSPKKPVKDWQPAPPPDSVQDAQHAEVEETDSSSNDIQTALPDSDTDIGDDTPAQEPQSTIEEPEAPEIPDSATLQEEAYDAGVVQGLKQAEKDFGSTFKAMSQICDQLNVIRETILKNSKNEMVELVLALSEKIIRHSVTEQNQTIIDTVETAIHQAVKSSEFYIYLHPDDMLIIQEHSQKFTSGLNGLDNIIVKADPLVERGGCKVESDNCTVDATIASQFKVLQDSIRKEV